MDVFLVSHGESRPENEDPAKSLSDRGRSDVSLVAGHLSSMGLKPSKIYHSDKLRSKQTAEILYDVVKPKHGIEEVKGIAPVDDLNIAEALISGANESIMIVGHLPHLGNLLSKLIIGDREEKLLKFDPGTVVCITSNDGSWIIAWSLNAAVIK